MPRGTPPALRLHKATGQGRVILDGRHVYLGEHGSPECEARYEEIVRKWRLAQTDPVNMTIDVLAIRYTEHADEYYRKPDGSPTGEANNVRLSLRPLVELFGRKLLRDVMPRDLRCVMNRMIDDGLARTTINQRAGRIKTMFTWAARSPTSARTSVTSR